VRQVRAVGVEGCWPELVGHRAHLDRGACTVRKLGQGR
jgi:hypothetical protein